MEIVLLEDVKALGKKGQIVKVNDGYARNFILPKKLGVEATSKNLNDLKLQKANAEKVAAEQLAAAQELAEKIEKLTVTLKMKAGEGGKAFGSVSSKEIAALLKTAMGASTVAMITTSAMIAPMMPALGFTSPLAKVLVIMAIGAGSMTVSHANDSYFWVVSQFSDMDTQDAYKCQTGMTAVMGVTTIIVVFILSLIFVH